MRLKSRPDDFVVEEILSPEAPPAVSEPGRPYALYRLTKTGLGTPEAIAQMARRLKLPSASITVGGLKDRHARTTQYVAVHVRRGHRLPPELRERDWSAERVGWCEQGMSADAVAGNRFRIVLRALPRRHAEQFEDLLQHFRGCADPAVPPRFINYFGEQRFGSARHGRGFAARALVDGDFETALRLLIATPSDHEVGRSAPTVRMAQSWGRWGELARTMPPGPEKAVASRLAATRGNWREGFRALPPFLQQMSLEAYQSWLWNRMAVKLVASQARPPFVQVDSVEGPQIHPASSKAGSLLDLVVPLLSPRTQLEPAWQEAAEEVLAEEDLRLDDLRIPGQDRPWFAATPRALIVEASEFAASVPVPDTAARDGSYKQQLDFILPRGSYATVLIRALSDSRPPREKRDRKPAPRKKQRPAGRR